MANIQERVSEMDCILPESEQSLIRTYKFTYYKNLDTDLVQSAPRRKTKTM